MKGIILAGGKGTRLYPVTMGLSKQLLPIYNKPMIYYPLSVLMLAGIRDIMIITDSENINNFKNLLKDGSQIGININYKIQNEANGIAEAFLIAEDFIEDDNVCLILGDNIFYGQNFSNMLKEASEIKNGALVFAYHVEDPENYGVVEFNEKGKVSNIIEKPKAPNSNYAVTGLYFYDNNVINFAKNLVPSDRGELEISDINLRYLKNNDLEIKILGRGFAWLDTGNHRSLLDAGIFVQTVEERQGLKIACLEEIAFNNKWISKEDLKRAAKSHEKTEYGKYLNQIIK